MSRTALILGAGIGGLVAAERLRKLLPAGDHVVAVDRVREHLFPPSLLWLMVGQREPADFTRALGRLSSKGVDLRCGTVGRIDPQGRVAEVDGSAIAADALIVALGTEDASDTIPGLAEAGMNMYAMEGAMAVRDALRRLKGGRIVIMTAAPAYKCPAAPYEAAMLLDSWLRERGLRDKTSLTLFAAEPQPMVVTGPEIGAAVCAMIKARGIVYRPKHQVSHVDASTRRIGFTNGETADFDLLIYVPPQRAPAAARAAGLCNESGWIPVDRHTLQTSFENVFAIGDVTTIPLGMGCPLPKAGMFAHGQAEVVADNIAHRWTGKGALRQFAGQGMCFIETGGGRAAIGKGNFYAEPAPSVDMHAPSLLWHAGKVLYEKYWLYSRF